MAAKKPLPEAGLMKYVDAVVKANHTTVCIDVILTDCTDLSPLEFFSFLLVTQLLRDNKIILGVSNPIWVTRWDLSHE